MDGRTEHELKVNKKIESMIEKYPEYLEDFNISMEAEGKTHNTRLTYMKAVTSYLDYLKEQGKNIDDVSIFRDITTTQIKKYFVTIRYEEKNGERVEKSGSYINIIQRSLGAFFRFLRESRLIDENPLIVDGQSIKIGKKKDKHATVVLNQEETAIFFSNIENGVGNKSAKTKQKHWRERDMAMMDLALNTGLRVSALTEINVNDINFDELTIDVIEKGNKAVTIEIDSKCADLLKDWIVKRDEILKNTANKTDALFISNKKQRISQNTVSALVKKYSSGINKKITPHKLRSTFATAAMIETGGSVHAVQTSLGHAGGGVTERYLGNKKEERRTVANAVRKYYTK